MVNLRKKFVPQVHGNIASEENFADLLKNVNSNHVKEGSVVKGQVINVGKDVVTVDVGLKNEGRINKEEFASLLPNIGDFIEVYVIKTEGRGNSGVILSREKAIREESWIKLEDMHEAYNKAKEAQSQGGAVINAEEYAIEGTIFGRVKGGFTVELEGGVVAFLPGSQVDVRPIKDMNPLFEAPQKFLILKMDKKLGNIVVSRRAILEEARSEARNEMLSTVEEGMIIEGTIKNITDYGAFVDLGNVDGLLHVTDISWSRINHPSEVLTIGQKVKVMVIKFNKETKRISLGMKQLNGDPWKDVQEEFPVGKIMTGKISNTTDYGVFIELKNGIEGLVHSSEISWVKSNQNSRKQLSIGQEVKFMILEIDAEKHRISLSIKQCLDNPILKFSETHPVGTIITAPIRNITDFGMFVALDGNIDGMIHETDISWQGDGIELLKSYKKGDEIQCKVLAVDVEKERVSLGIKQLEEEPVKEHKEEFKKNSTVTCTVTEITNDGIAVSLNDEVSGFIKKGDLSSEKTEQKPERFAIGDRLDAKIIATEKNGSKAVLSIKAWELDERKKVIKEYGSADSGASLGDILGAALGENLNQKKKNK